MKGITSMLFTTAMFVIFKVQMETFHTKFVSIFIIYFRIIFHVPGCYLVFDFGKQFLRGSHVVVLH
jgi:hypothetical protein